MLGELRRIMVPGRAGLMWPRKWAGACRAAGNTINEPSGSKKVENFLTSRYSISFSIRILLRGVGYMVALSFTIPNKVV
jgi:hypothetical protein